MAGNDEHRFNVNASASELKILIQTTDLSTPSECCIFRVPNILRRHNPQAYEPNAFSIGPFHHHQTHLKATQTIKLKYLQSLLSRCPGTDLDAKLRLLSQGISEDLQSYRNCYEGSIDMSMEKFLEVLVLDGCFLVELFRKERYNDLQEEDDPIFSKCCMFELIQRDLILLENQIPWGVLDRVFDMTMVDHIKHKASLVELVIHFYNILSCTSPMVETASAWSNDLHQSKHILDFLRNAMVLPFPNKLIRLNRGFSWQAIPTVATLEEAGIIFKISNSSESIFTINFTDNGVLEIPNLHVDEITEPLFRNLISYEQCLPNCEGVVTSYGILMDKLINTAADLEVLCRNGIIRNTLSVEETTKFFNQLYNDTYIKDYHYTSIEASINKYCRRHWPRYRRALIHDYFKHPWAIISLAAAIILLVLTFLQTFFTIKK